MSKHWQPRTIPGGRPAPYRRPSRRRRGSRRSGRTAKWVVIYGLLLGIAYSFFPPATPSDVALPGGGVRVEDVGAVEIVDGDTFRYDGEKIRIADIDTPELKGRCEKETELAARATDRMEALLHQGPFEMVPIEGREEDRYGRKLRVIVRGGRSLGDQLVAEGLARTWEGRRRPWCA